MHHEGGSEIDIVNLHNGIRFVTVGSFGAVTGLSCRTCLQLVGGLGQTNMTRAAQHRC